MNFCVWWFLDRQQDPKWECSDREHHWCAFAFSSYKLYRWNDLILNIWTHSIQNSSKKLFNTGRKIFSGSQYSGLQSHRASAWTDISQQSKGHYALYQGFSVRANPFVCKHGILCIQEKFWIYQFNNIKFAMVKHGEFVRLSKF